MTNNRIARGRGLGLAVALVLALLLGGCGDRSAIISGTGDSGVTSDGGAQSAAFAGTYSGTITLNAKGDDIDETDTSSAVLVVRDDGTAQLTIDGNNVIEGFMNGRNFGFSITVIEEDGPIECDAMAIITGMISGANATGNVSGNGDCDVLIAVGSSFTVTGSMSLTRQ